MSDPRITEEDAARVDKVTKQHFRSAPVEDRSGMLLPSEPANPEPTEDEQFDAFMRRTFPGRAP